VTAEFVALCIFDYRCYIAIVLTIHEITSVRSTIAIQSAPEAEADDIGGLTLFGAHMLPSIDLAASPQSWLAR